MNAESRPTSSRPNCRESDAGVKVFSSETRRHGCVAILWIVLATCFFSSPELFAIDAAHNNSNGCSSCHLLHQSKGGTLSSVAGNGNLCMSCHTSGGSATSKAFSDSDKATTSSGLGSSGTSHRWDASVSGRVVFGGGASTGTLVPGGLFTGRYSKTYTITITTAGAAGSARFSWSATGPAGTSSATGIATGSAVALDEGTRVTFSDGTTGTSFVLGNQWTLFVHAGMNSPSQSALANPSKNGIADCSSCHEPHAAAGRAFGSSTNGQFLRFDNASGQLCTECHATHNVGSGSGKHPVGVSVPSDSTHKAPGSMPLLGGNIACLTCHKVHHADVADGNLLRTGSGSGAGVTTACTDCHTQSDMTGTPAHFVSSDTRMLWPGGKLGSTMPARSASADRGTCLNCHAVHGWPDASNPAAKYPKLLAESSANLCMTCHGATGPALKTVNLDTTKARGHLNPATTSIPVGCQDCHNPHKAKQGIRTDTDRGLTGGNLVGGPMSGASGVAIPTFTGLGNFAAIPGSAYQAVATATHEYEVCMKCHSSYAGAPRAGQTPNGTATSPVQTDLAQEFSPENMSGHPIYIGLEHYTRSLPVGSPLKKGLQTAAMRGVWKNNVGEQTMTCGDCHNTDGSSTAAQGPHGSAQPFMLRTFGRQATSNLWPNVTLNNGWERNWCSNCHENVGGEPHNVGDHRGFQCSQCHIVVPHGGKVSRLLADNDSMPARYAANNTLNTQNLQAVTKRAVTGSNVYGQSNCKAQCHSGHSGRTITTASESW